MGRRVHLSTDDFHTLELEKERLRVSYGLRVSEAQVLSILLAHHRLNLRRAAEQDDARDVLAWLWRKRDDEAD